MVMLLVLNSTIIWNLALILISTTCNTLKVKRFVTIVNKEFSLNNSVKTCFIVLLDIFNLEYRLLIWDPRTVQTHFYSH